MTKRQLFHGISAVLLVATSVTAGENRQISGTVRDPEGNPIGSIALILAPVASGEPSETVPHRVSVNPDGGFIGSMPQGDYRIIGTSPACFLARELTIGDGDNLELVLEWNAKPPLEDEGGPAGTSASFRIGFSAGPTSLNLLRFPSPGGGFGLSTRGFGGGLDVNVTRMPNGGGIAVDPMPDCDRWKAGSQ
jgi:hypothetical protein